MRALLAIMFLLAALVVVGPAAASDPKQPQQRHTAADTKLAKALALQQGDLPVGWSRVKPTPDPPPCKTEPDESNLVQTAQIDPTFVWRDGVTTLGTQVDIFKTAAMARTDWALSTLRLFQSCLLQSAHEGFPHNKVRLVSAKQLPSPVAAAERSLHYRLVVSIARGATVVPIVTDVIALGRGRETVVMHSSSLRVAPPAASVNHLVQELANRLGTGGI